MDTLYNQQIVYESIDFFPDTLLLCSFLVCSRTGFPEDGTVDRNGTRVPGSTSTCIEHIVHKMNSTPQGRNWVILRGGAGILCTYI